MDSIDGSLFFHVPNESRNACKKKTERRKKPEETAQKTSAKTKRHQAGEKVSRIKIPQLKHLEICVVEKR
jgi:hypothetical protein